jgi:hypothetical protein
MKDYKLKQRNLRASHTLGSFTTGTTGSKRTVLRVFTTRKYPPTIGGYLRVLKDCTKPTPAYQVKELTFRSATDA